MAITVGYLVDRTFDLLLGADRQELNRLTTTIGATDTVLTVDFAPKGAVTGTYITIDDESMYVWSNAPGSSTGTVTVQRGARGTTAAAHTAGSLIYVNPYFTRYQVRETLRDVIRSWAPQVFRVKTVDIASTDLVLGYDLGNISPFLFPLDVRISPDIRFQGPTPSLAVSTNDKNWYSVPYRVTQSSNTTTFPSGNALTITDPLGVFDSPRTFHFVYAAPFDVDTIFTDATDVVNTVGLDTSDLDIPPLGAAAQLAIGREMRRMLTEAQGQVSDLQQYPPGYATSAAEKFQKRHDDRFNDAVQRLRAMYPVRRVG